MPSHIARQCSFKKALRTRVLDIRDFDQVLQSSSELRPQLRGALYQRQVLAQERCQEQGQVLYKELVVLTALLIGLQVDAHRFS